jgi:hypothetical protein
VRWAGKVPDETRDGARLVDLEAPQPAAGGYPARLPIGGDLFVVPASRLGPLDARQIASLGRLAVERLPALLEQATFEDERAAERAHWAAAMLGAAVKGPAALDASSRSSGDVACSG